MSAAVFSFTRIWTITTMLIMTRELLSTITLLPESRAKLAQLGCRGTLGRLNAVTLWYSLVVADREPRTIVQTIPFKARV